MLRFFRFLILALTLCPIAALAHKPININTASAETLQQINGINSARAHAIVKYRKTHGYFASVNDLINVPGISKSMLNKIRPQVTVAKPHRAERHHSNHYVY
ncbi:MAG: helix-hairpin-helix domain-containing protein [Betaproteobacteria bacterium]|nr:helix-hairpin-helix domain-containing protein [Betaproteobacteria bacterium]